MTDIDYLGGAMAMEPSVLYRTLRDECPLHHVTDHDPDFFVLSRFDDVVSTLLQATQWGNRQGPGVFVQEGGVLGGADDPDHQRHRRVLRDAFLPTVINRMEDHVRELASTMLEEILPLGACDFVDAFAFPFPALVIGEILGVRAEDRGLFRQWSTAIVDGLTGGDLVRFDEARVAMNRYIDARMAEREPVIGDRTEVEPDDDVLTRLFLARRNGVVTGGEVRSLALQLLVAGHETTTSLLGLMLQRLIERPELMARLRADRSLLPAAIEEALRFDSPVSGLFRTSTEEHEVRGCPIPAGTKLQLLYGAANRDPAQFPDPDTFRLDRSPTELGKHVAFGWGVHHCIGAPVARLETRVAFDLILDRMDAIEIAGPIERNRSIILHGLTSLPIRWKVRAA
jgi:cytochrome P450